MTQGVENEGRCNFGLTNTILYCEMVLIFGGLNEVILLRFVSVHTNEICILLKKIQALQYMKFYSVGEWKHKNRPTSSFKGRLLF